MRAKMVEGIGRTALASEWAQASKLTVHCCAIDEDHRGTAPVEFDGGRVLPAASDCDGHVLVLKQAPCDN